jgi:virginiamycin B lyase
MTGCGRAKHSAVGTTRRVPLWLCVLACALSCSSEDKPRGELMLAISADASIPKDINQVVVEVLNDNGNKQSFTYPILPGDLGKPMPGTLALIPPNAGGQHVRIRLIAEHDSGTGAAPTPRVVREAVVNVPTDRTAVLPMPLRWLCYGQVTPADESFRSDCGADETCVAGECVTAVRESSKLADYDAREVFGGGDANGRGGQCMNVQKCFATSTTVAPDASCTLALPSGASLDTLNIAMLPANGDGECAAGDKQPCFIPLDHDPDEGWSIAHGRILLPKAVCKKLDAGNILSMVLTTSCPAKNGSVPICGPWTSVTTEQPLETPGAGGATENGGASGAGGEGGAAGTAGAAGSGATSDMITEFPVPGGKPYDLVSGPDGNLWFTEIVGENIGRITPAGDITEFRVPGASGNLEGITAGPDGNLWFADLGANNVGRITPSGTITTFPTPGFSPNGIASGPDGNLWFTAYTNAHIGTITPKGIMNNLFPVPTEGIRIALGADRNLWFTESGGANIGRITPAGVVTEFPVPTVSSLSEYIALGADGNLWFAESDANNIGRITRSGAVTEFPVPTTGGEPVGVTLGADGNVWITESGSNKIASITPSGVFTEFAVPTADSNPWTIVWGPDGNVWFTEYVVNKIGRLAVP